MPNFFNLCFCRLKKIPGFFHRIFIFLYDFLRNYTDGISKYALEEDEKDYFVLACVLRFRAAGTSRVLLKGFRAPYRERVTWMRTDPATKFPLPPLPPSNIVVIAFIASLVLILFASSPIAYNWINFGMSIT